MATFPTNRRTLFTAPPPNGHSQAVLEVGNAPAVAAAAQRSIQGQAIGSPRRLEQPNDSSPKRSRAAGMPSTHAANSEVDLAALANSLLMGSPAPQRTTTVQTIPSSAESARTPAAPYSPTGSNASTETGSSFASSHSPPLSSASTTRSLIFGSFTGQSPNLTGLNLRSPVSQRTARMHSALTDPLGSPGPSRRAEWAASDGSAIRSLFGTFDDAAATPTAAAGGGGGAIETSSLCGEGTKRANPKPTPSYADAPFIKNQAAMRSEIEARLKKLKDHQKKIKAGLVDEGTLPDVENFTIKAGREEMEIDGKSLVFLGAGNFSHVYGCRSKDDPTRRFVIRLFKEDSRKEGISFGLQSVKDLKKKPPELILEYLGHQFIRRAKIQSNKYLSDRHIKFHTFDALIEEAMHNPELLKEIQSLLAESVRGTDLWGRDMLLQTPVAQARAAFATKYLTEGYIVAEYAVTPCQELDYGILNQIKTLYNSLELTLDPHLTNWDQNGRMLDIYEKPYDSKHAAEELQKVVRNKHHEELQKTIRKKYQMRSEAQTAEIEAKVAEEYQMLAQTQAAEIEANVAQEYQQFFGKPAELTEELTQKTAWGELLYPSNGAAGPASTITAVEEDLGW